MIRRLFTSFLAIVLMAGSSAFAASTFTITSSTSGSSTRFIVTRDDATTAETVHYRTVPLSAFPGQHFTAQSGTLNFAAGAQLRTTVTFHAREKDDGYQYIAIYANTPTGNVDTGAKDGDPGTIVHSSYMAGFTIDGNVSSTYCPYTFPLTSKGGSCGEQTHPWSGNSNGNLQQQYFNTDCRAADGRLIIPTDLDSLYVRLNASGNLNDTWYASNVVAHVQAVDSAAPTRISVAAAPGVRARGNELYVSVAFSEAVTVIGQPSHRPCPVCGQSPCVCEKICPVCGMPKSACICEKPPPREVEVKLSSGRDISAVWECYVFFDDEMIQVKDFLERFVSAVRHSVSDPDALREKWSTEESRGEFLTAIAAAGFTEDLLRDVQKFAQLQEYDVLDMMLDLAYNVPPVTRAIRVERMAEALDGMTFAQRKLAETVLGEYVENGVWTLNRGTLTDILNTLYCGNMMAALADLGFATATDALNFFGNIQQQLYAA